MANYNKIFKIEGTLLRVTQDLNQRITEGGDSMQVTEGNVTDWNRIKTVSDSYLLINEVESFFINTTEDLIIRKSVDVYHKIANV